MLITAWSRSFGLRVPIVNAPMGGVAGGRLAAAVTAAGGLGMVGMGSLATSETLAAELRRVTGRFGIGLVDWVMRNEAALFEDALAAQPALLSVSFGTDWSWVARAHDAGITTATQVYDAVEARRAADAGVDILVARGAEGGGHGDVKLATLPLLDTVLDAVSVPVLAGGGIASPRSLAAVLAAGASGAWVGTRLAACPEALTGDGSRRALIAAGGTDTLVTRVFDVASGLPWPARFPSRVLDNDFVAHWTGREEALAADQPASAQLAAATAADDRRIAPVDAGQGVGMINDDASVGEVIETMCAGAERLLTGWGAGDARRGLQHDATPIRAGTESGVGTVRCQRVGHAGDQRVVHVAGQLRLLLGQRVERAVGQVDFTVGAARFVAVLAQHVDRQPQRRRGVIRGVGRGLADRRAVIVGDPVEYLDHRLAGCDRLGDGRGHKPSGQLVFTLREAYRDVAAGPAVQLGGPSRAGARSAGQACVLGFQ